MTENIEYNTILEVTDYKIAVHLLINLKYAVILENTISPIQNTPHPMSLVFYKTIFRYPQYKTEAATDHYF